MSKGSKPQQNASEMNPVTCQRDYISWPVGAIQKWKDWFYAQKSVNAWYRITRIK